MSDLLAGLRKLELTLRSASIGLRGVVDVLSQLRDGSSAVGRVLEIVWPSLEGCLGELRGLDGLVGELLQGAESRAIKSRVAYSVRKYRPKRLRVRRSG